MWPVWAAALSSHLGHPISTSPTALPHAHRFLPLSLALHPCEPPQQQLGAPLLHAVLTRQPTCTCPGGQYWHKNTSPYVHLTHAGSTDTSLWTHYKAGAREYCGNHFADGMCKNDLLPKNVITPTTKSDEHDVPISPQEIVAQGLMSQKDWDMVRWCAGL